MLVFMGIYVLRLMGDSRTIIDNQCCYILRRVSVSDHHVLDSDWLHLSHRLRKDLNSCNHRSGVVYPREIHVSPGSDAEFPTIRKLINRPSPQPPLSSSAQKKEVPFIPWSQGCLSYRCYQTSGTHLPEYCLSCGCVVFTPDSGVLSEGGKQPPDCEVPRMDSPPFRWEMEKAVPKFAEFRQHCQELRIDRLESAFLVDGLTRVLLPALQFMGLVLYR